MIWEPETSPYVMLYGDRFLPVTALFRDGRGTLGPASATSATLYAGPGHWIATAVWPGDIQNRVDRESWIGNHPPRLN